jgi:integrase
VGDAHGRGRARQAQLPTLSKPLRDVLTRDEIDLLEKVVDNERDKLIVRIFSDCGLRINELTQLAPGDIVRSGRQVYPRVLGKLSRVRDVPLPPQILRRLERYIDSRPADRAADRIFLSHRRGASVQVISEHYTHLTKDDAYEAMMRVLSAVRT